MKKIIFFVIFLGGFFVFTPVFAAEYYIDANNGNDADAGSETAPWQSLSKINSISGGDTVYLKGDFTGLGGTLTLNSTISGTATDTTEIKKWPGESPAIQVISGSYTLGVSANYVTFSGLNFNNNGNFVTSCGAINLNDTYQNLTIEDSVFQDCRVGVSSNGTAANGVSNITITDNTFSNALYAVYLNYTDTANITGNTFKNNLGSGVTALYGSTILVANNIFNNNDAYGAAGSFTANFRVINNTMYGNGFGVWSASANGVLAKNNIITNSSFAAIGHNGSTNVSYDFNLFHNNSKIGNIGGTAGTFYNLTDWQTLNFDASSFTGDPALRDISNDNFHIKATSVAIDAGLDVSNFITTDFDGETRSGSYDIGADERVVPSAPASLSVNYRKPTELKIGWTDSSTVTANFEKVYSAKKSFVSSTTETNNVNTLELDNLKNNKRYYFKIRACTSIGVCSDYLEDSYRTKPAKVMNIRVQPKYLKSNSAKIRWKRMVRVKKYKIKLTYKTSKGKTKKKYYNVKNNKVNGKLDINGSKVKIKRKTLKNLKPGTDYSLKIKSIFNKNNKSKYSDKVSFTTL